jgi:hypothetical protein
MLYNDIFTSIQKIDDIKLVQYETAAFDLCFENSGLIQDQTAIKFYGQLTVSSLDQLPTRIPKK